MITREQEAETGRVLQSLRGFGAPISESLTVVRAIGEGRTDENTLTDLVFYQRYPERRGRQLTPGEARYEDMRTAWMDLREMIVRPVLWAHIRNTARQVALEEWRRWDFGRLVENRREVQERLKLYWATVRRTPTPTLWSWAWSSVFVSFVLQEAGVGGYFPPASYHVQYVHRAARNARDDLLHPVKALPVDQITPRVGDVICYWRMRKGLPLTYDDLAAQTAPGTHPTHGSVVTSVAQDHLEAVSGNASPPRGTRCAGADDGCTVNRSRYPLVGGRLAPLPPNRKGELKRGWLAVVRIGP